LAVKGLNYVVKCFLPFCSLDYPTNVITEQVFNAGKIFSLNFLSIGHKSFLLACGPEGELKLLEVKKDEATGKPVKMDKLAVFTLPHSKQRWVTDALLLSSSDCGLKGWKLVCGDRRGSLHLFHESSKVRHCS